MLLRFLRIPWGTFELKTMCVNCLCNVATDGSFDLLNSPGAIAMIGEMLDHTQVKRGEEDGGHKCKREGLREGGREGGR